MTATLTATALNNGGRSEQLRTRETMVLLRADVGGQPSFYLSRRERGFDSRWDHQTNQFT